MKIKTDVWKDKDLMRASLVRGSRIIGFSGLFMIIIGIGGILQNNQLIYSILQLSLGIPMVLAFLLALLSHHKWIKEQTINARQ